jgi:hypothetical protein
LIVAAMVLAFPTEVKDFVQLFLQLIFYDFLQSIDTLNIYIYIYIYINAIFVYAFTRKSDDLFVGGDAAVQSILLFLYHNLSAILHWLCREL